MTRKTKSVKRREAEDRQRKYNALSKEQKIALAKSRRGNSKKELERLGD